MRTHDITLQAIFTGDDDGTKRGGLTSLPSQLIDGLNQIYESAGVRFSNTVHYLERYNTLLNRRFTVPGNLAQHTNRQAQPTVDNGPNTKARTDLAAQYPGRLVIYFSFGGELFFNDQLGHWDLRPESANYSGWDSCYVSMNQNAPAAPDLAHEIGHYLQLAHPFSEGDRGNPESMCAAAEAIRWYVEQEGHPRDEGLDVFDGDRLSVGDTPPDGRGTIMAIANDGADNPDVAKCGPVASLLIPVSFSDHTKKNYTLKPDRSLVMSYFKGCPGRKTFSPHQASRIRRGLELGIRHRLITLRPDGLKKLVERRASHSAGGVNRVSISQLEEQRVVTAVITESGRLKLIVWDIADGGSEVHRRGDVEAGHASHVRVCGLACHIVLTGHKNSADELELITWRVKKDGTLERLHSVTGGAINGLVMCRQVIDYTDYVITAVRDEDDNLKLIAWQITPFGRIIKKAETDGGECDLVSISSMGPNGVMTYVRLTNHRLKGILWEVRSGEIVRVENHFTDKSIDDLSACALDVDLTASVVRTHGNLQVITWETKEGTLSVNRTADSGNQGGPIGELAACRMGTKLLVTAAQDSSHRLKVSLWEVRDQQDIIRIHDSDVEEAASHITVCRAGQDLFATAFCDQQGNLKIVAWQVS